MTEIISDITIDTATASGSTTVPHPRKAHIAGGNAVLFRCTNSTEKPLSHLGTYDTSYPLPSPTGIDDIVYNWPNKPENSIVDLVDVTVRVEQGLLLYFTNSTGTITENSVNSIIASDVVFATNSDEDRDAEFLDRDCQVGDIVDLTVGDTTLRTSITGLVADGSNGITILTLKHNLPAAMMVAADIELSLYIPVDGVVIPEIKEDYPGDVNYVLDDEEVTLSSSIMLFEDSWTDSGTPISLPLIYGEVFVDYRAWVADKANAVYECEDTTDLELIPGALSPRNPLKWGVYVALNNSAGVGVKYTAVADPDDTGEWAQLLEWLGDEEDVYGLVPLTHNATVLSHYIQYANERRDEDRPVAVWYCETLLDTTLVVTSTDATITELGSTGSYTLLIADGGTFITNGVQVGDTVIYNYGVDAWGRITYDLDTVEAVVNEQTLVLTTGAETEITVAAPISVRRDLTTNALLNELVTTAAEIDNRYVRLVWPDEVVLLNNTCAGYFLAAVLAGKRSGLYPHQSLTNQPLTDVTPNTRMTGVFSVTQRNTLVDSGVWVVNRNFDDDIVTRRGVTTAQTTELDYVEEAIISNTDAIDYRIRKLVEEYKGKSNVVSSLIRYLNLELIGLFEELGTSVSLSIGSQIIDGGIDNVYASATDVDTIVVQYTINVPAPFNKLQIVNQITVGLN